MPKFETLRFFRTNRPRSRCYRRKIITREGKRSFLFFKVLSSSTNRKRWSITKFRKKYRTIRHTFDFLVRIRVLRIRSLIRFEDGRRSGLCHFARYDLFSTVDTRVCFLLPLLDALTIRRFASVRLREAAKSRPPETVAFSRVCDDAISCRFEVGSIANDREILNT